jgi:hypothetical protein
MALAIYPEQFTSPTLWLHRALHSVIPTSSESEQDLQRPTELRNSPPATNDRQGSPHIGMVSQGEEARAVPFALDDLPPQTAAWFSLGTVSDQNNQALAALAAAAEMHDEAAYLAAYRLVDWDRSDAAMFEMAIHLAFTAGAHMAARLLATKGAAMHPNSDYLRRAAYVLAPPRVITHDLPAEGATTANRAWMVANRNSFLGQWVALRNGELLGSAAKLKELTTRFGVAPEILYARVT